MGSLVLDAAGDYIRRTASVPSSFEAFTICGWCKVNSSTDGTNNRQIFEVASSGDLRKIYFDSSNVLRIHHWWGGSDPFSATPNRDQWIFYSLSATTGTTDSVFGRWYYDNSGTLTLGGSVMAENQSGTPDSVLCGTRRSVDYGFAAKFAYVKVWDRRLLNAEIEAEAYSPTVVDDTNFNTGFADSATDIGGNGRDWTLNSITTDSDTPPVNLITPIVMTWTL
jgi:hypothetical protein